MACGPSGTTTSAGRCWPGGGPAGWGEGTVGMYGELPGRHGRALRARLPEHFERLRWPAERLAAERRRELQRLVRAARRLSPWHRERLDGIDVDRLDETGLADLPVMTKDDLRANFYAIATDRRPRPHHCAAPLEDH